MIYPHKPDAQVFKLRDSRRNLDYREAVDIATQ